MPSTMVLRFRDLVAETILEHRELIQTRGHVWWGWWNKPQEKIPRSTFAEFQHVVHQKGVLPVYLVDSGRNLLYTATLTDIRPSPTEEAIPCPEPDAVPGYYARARYKAWLKFIKIDDAPSEVLRDYSYDEVAEFLDDPSAERFKDKRVFSVQEMLNRQHRTIYFLQSYEERHRDYDLELLPAIAPRNFIVTPIVTRSIYILHLSDPHFGLRHRFETKGGKLQKTLATLCIDDLRRTYPDMPPAAVIVSGDLTWLGRAQEFDAARDSVERIRSAFGLEPYHFVVVPGNHDIQWSPPGPRDYDKRKPVRQPASTAEANYRSFYKELFGIAPTSYLSLGRRYILGNYVSLDVVGLNSSRLEQRPFAGYGYVSVEQLEDAAGAMQWTSEPQRTTYRMLTLHHHVVPVSPKEEISSYDKIYSLTLDAGQLMYKAQELGIDLVAHGHMHQPFVASLSRRIRTAGASATRSIAVTGAGSSGVARPYLGDIGKNSYSIYEFDLGGVTAIVRSGSEDFEGFAEDWRCRFERPPDGKGLLLAQQL